VPAALAQPGAHLHLYDKAEVRPGRKMGHVTVLDGTTDSARARARAAADAVGL
jgi:5-(carboxyamino)imidazole ribonucleotide synthase